jgi:hypothetical protein
MNEAPVALQDGATGTMDKLDKVTREKTTGTFVI